MRDALGDRWREVSANVFALAEHILRRHLGPNDACHRTADDGFLVCFAELDEAEAQLKAQQIAEEIRATLTGIAPEMATANVTGFAARVSIDANESGSDEAIIQALEGRLARERRRLEGGAIEILRASLAEAQILFQRVRTETNQVAPFTAVRLPKPLESALDTLRALAGRITGWSRTPAADRGGGAAAQRAYRHPHGCHRRAGAHVDPGPAARRRALAADRPIDGPAGQAPSGDRNHRTLARHRPDPHDRSRDDDLIALPRRRIRAARFGSRLRRRSPRPTVSVVTIPLPRLGNEEGSGHVPAATKLVKALSNRNCRLLVKGVASPTQAMSLAKAGVSLLLTQLDPAAAA